MANKKSYKGTDIVLVVKGSKKEISADSFSCIDFKGLTVSGESYYVDKAVKLGATKTD